MGKRSVAQGGVWCLLLRANGGGGVNSSSTSDELCWGNFLSPHGRCVNCYKYWGTFLFQAAFDLLGVIELLAEVRPVLYAHPRPGIQKDLKNCMVLL